jgi:DNA-binding GntR family transcriptional regulator
MDALELLLRAEIPDLPEKTYKLKRLSAIYGEPVVFKLRALPYNRAAEITKNQTEEMNVHIILAGTVEPNLKSSELLAKFNAVTPAELVKKMLLPGEIEDLSRAIEKLSGYREVTLVEIKKK